MITRRSVLFSLKCTRNRLAAGLRPDPVGELKRSSRPPSRIRGLGPPGREGKGGNGKGGNGKGGNGKGENEGKRGEGKEGRGRKERKGRKEKGRKSSSPQYSLAGERH